MEKLERCDFIALSAETYMSGEFQSGGWEQPETSDGAVFSSQKRRGLVLCLRPFFLH